MLCQKEICSLKPIQEQKVEMYLGEDFISQVDINSTPPYS